MSDYEGLKVFTGNSNIELANKIAKKIGIPLGKALVGRFSDGEVQVELYFSRDEQRIATMHGHYQVDAPLLCQRCLEQVVVPIDSECDVGFVTSDEAAKQLPRHYEPVIVGDEPLDLHALIEDELLLALPAVPMHPQQTCQHPPGYRPETAELEEKSEKPNPFSVLAKLKRDT